MLDNPEAVQAEIDKNFWPYAQDTSDPEIRELEEDDKIHEWTMLPLVHPSPASEEGGESEEAVESSRSSPFESDFSDAEQMMDRRRQANGDA